MPNGQNAFLSPEGVLMMTIAIILDLVGLMMLILSFVGVGIPFSFILDAIGIIFIGGWVLFFRSGKGVITKGAAKRLGLGTLGELIPFVGDLLPCWTLIVYFELKS